MVRRGRTNMRYDNQYLDTLLGVKLVSSCVLENHSSCV